MLKALMKQGIAVEGDAGVDERAKIEIRLDAALADERHALLEHRRFGGVATHRRDQRELFERLVERDS